MSAVDPTPPFYAGDELQAIRLAAIQSALAERGLDGLLLLKHDAVRFVTGFYAKGYRPFVEFEYAALVPAAGLPVLGTALAGEEDRARLRSRAGDVRRLPKLRDWGAALAAILEDHGLARGHVGFDLMPHFVHRDLRTALPSLALVDAADLWAGITAVKHPLEVALLREALAIAEDGLRAAVEALRPGVTEVAVSAAAEHAMRLRGSELNPFVPVVASGSNAAVWERVATERVIGDREMVILDFGCVHRGYTGDVARTAVVGEPSPAQRRLYRAAHLALQEAIAAVRPGVACGALDALVREVIEDEGLGRYAAPWAVGHQLGYGLHGAPLLGPGVEEPLRVGMVVNIEPALFTADDPAVGGVELEDTVLVTGDGCERLTLFPYDDRLLEA